jgi:hypothetical protein
VAGDTLRIPACLSQHFFRQWISKDMWQIYYDNFDMEEE